MQQQQNMKCTQIFALDLGIFHKNLLDNNKKNPLK